MILECAVIDFHELVLEIYRPVASKGRTQRRGFINVSFSLPETPNQSLRGRKVYFFSLFLCGI